DAGPVLAREHGEPVVDVVPLLVRRHRRQLAAGRLDGEVEDARVALVDDGAGLAAGEEGPDQLDRVLRRRQADPLRPPRAQRGEGRGWSSRSGDSARCALGRSSATAWISSTMTVSTPARFSRPRVVVRTMYRLSGVVTKMCGGSLAFRCRSPRRAAPGRTRARSRPAGPPAPASS